MYVSTVYSDIWIFQSVGFHESGKKHKENVAKRLAEISKNSLKSHNESVQVDLEMKKMEEVK